MKNGRTVRERQKLLAFLGKAPLERLLLHSKISHFSRDSLVSITDQLVESAFLVLSGSCEHRQRLPGGSVHSLQTLKTGETFGGYGEMTPDIRASEVVAREDSVVLGIHLDDLALLASNTRGNLPQAVPERNTTFFFHTPKGKLTTLIFPAELPVRVLAENIARQLQKESSAPTILVRLLTSDESKLGLRPPVDCSLNGHFALPPVLRTNESGVRVLNVEIPRDPPDAEILGDLFHRLRRHFHHVLVAVSVGHLPELQLIECINQSASSYYFLRRAKEDLYRLELLIRELHNAAVKPVLCLAEGETAEEFDIRLENIRAGAHAFLRSCPFLHRTEASDLARQTSFSADIRRLAREIDDRLVGLALSSGGAKGFAHIGVLQVLEENGIEVDVVAGASMGAYVASIWAAGYDGAKLEELAHEMEGHRAMWTLLDPVLVPWQGFLRGYAVKRRLQRTIGEAQFSDMVRPLRVVAANLDTMERVVFSSGEVATAVHASIAVPGICIPVKIGGELYIDGGIVDPLPTDVLREMNVHKIIAVNTIPTPDKIRFCLQAERELARKLARPSPKLLRKLIPAHQYVNHYARGNVLEILMHSTHGAQMRVAEANARQASLVLQPDMCDDRWLDFRNPGQYIKAGREIALQRLDEIKALIKEKGEPHEHESPPTSMAEAA